jgi:hypothetical protein
MHSALLIMNYALNIKKGFMKKLITNKATRKVAVIMLALGRCGTTTAFHTEGTPY